MLRARQSRALMRLRSQCYRLRLQKPDLDMEALEARSCLPPELPAGKRGGWHHDSVYPSFASPPCPTGVELRSKYYRIDLSVDAPQICRGVRSLGGDPIAAGCGA